MRGCLVLSRKEGETIKLTHAGVEVAEIEVAHVSGGRVTLAIKAPQEVRVMRNEIIGREFKPTEGICQP